MIPKIIHYCWFGHDEYPEKVAYCIETWKKYLSDYELRLWNEDNFDVSCCDFAKQAYEEKKYAFVSDYVRLVALKNYGGIYLDTDVEVVKAFDDILHHDMVLGTDDCGVLITSFMAAEAGHPFFSEMEELYRCIKFKMTDGRLNMKVNTQWLQERLERYGFKEKNEHQELEHGIVVYSDEYFHAKSLVSGELRKTNNTYCIHHHTLLWVPFYTKIIKFLRIRILVPILGAEKYQQKVKRIKELWKGRGHDK